MAVNDVAKHAALADPAVVIEVMLLISGPAVVLAWLKLRSCPKIPSAP